MDKFRKKLHDFKENARVFLKEKGLYVVLMVCVCAIGIAAAFAFAPEKQDNSPAPTPESAAPASQSSDERIDALRTPEATLTTTPTDPVPDFTQAPEKPEATPTPKLKPASPVDGTVIWGYAVDSLIYSRTLDQWMTHAGVDISAKKGDEVRAVYSGTVEDVFEDDALGFTVMLRHKDSLVTMYSNLKEEIPVDAGDRVNARDVIGYVGDSAISECADPSHVHFAVYSDGEPQDPEGYVLIMKEPQT